MSTPAQPPPAARRQGRGWRADGAFCAFTPPTPGARPQPHPQTGARTRLKESSEDHTAQGRVLPRDRTLGRWGRTQVPVAPVGEGSEGPGRKPRMASTSSDLRVPSAPASQWSGPLPPPRDASTARVSGPRPPRASLPGLRSTPRRGCGRTGKTWVTVRYVCHFDRPSARKWGMG